MNQRVLITGHSKGIGLQTTKLLLNKNIEVTGIARTKIPEQNNLTQIQSDLSNVAELKKLCNSIKNNSVNTLILNAGFNFIKPPESYSVDEIIDLCTVNYTSHAAIIRACLPSLIQNKGTIIALSSLSANEVQKWNNFYGASKAGLQHLMNNLFEQYRKQGLRVTTIIPDIVNSSFYSKQDFEPGSDAETFIDEKQIAQLIFDLIVNPKPYVTTTITIRPQKFELNRKRIYKVLLYLLFLIWIYTTSILSPIKNKIISTPPTIILYTPNHLKPYLFKMPINVFMAISATINAIMFPKASNFISSPDKVKPSSK